MITTVFILSLATLPFLVLVEGSEGENCADISRYQEVEYNVTETELCTFSVVKECQTRAERVCTVLEETVCQVGGYAEQDMEVLEQSLPADHTLELEYVQKVCTPKPTQLVEQKMMPQCKIVTKEQCDSKWVINSQGRRCGLAMRTARVSPGRTAGQRRLMFPRMWRSMTVLMEK